MSGLEITLSCKVDCACGSWGETHCDCTGLRYRFVSEWFDADSQFFYTVLRPKRLRDVVLDPVTVTLPGAEDE